MPDRRRARFAVKRRGGARHSETFVLQSGLLTGRDREAWKQGVDGVSAASVADTTGLSARPIASGLRDPVNPPDANKTDNAGVRGESLK